MTSFENFKKFLDYSKDNLMSSNINFTSPRSKKQILEPTDNIFVYQNGLTIPAYLLTLYDITRPMIYSNCVYNELHGVTTCALMVYIRKEDTESSYTNIPYFTFTFDMEISEIEFIKNYRRNFEYYRDYILLQHLTNDY